MTLNERKAALNKYSKETIIDYLATGRFISFEELLKGLKHHRNLDNINKDYAEFERLSNADTEATNNLINFKKELFNKYGSPFSLAELTRDELNKLYELQTIYEKHHGAYMKNIEKDLKRNSKGGSKK